MPSESIYDLPACPVVLLLRSPRFTACRYLLSVHREYDRLPEIQELYKFAGDLNGRTQ